HRSGIELGESGVVEFVSDGNGEGDGVAAVTELRERLGDNGLTECGVTYPGGADQSCLILWSPHTGERNPASALSPNVSSLYSFDSQIRYDNGKFATSGFGVEASVVISWLFILIALVYEKRAPYPYVEIFLCSYKMVNSRTRQTRA
ncbi:hypothetical protein HID58_043633, partial [Brassica napus]